MVILRADHIEKNTTLFFFFFRKEVKNLIKMFGLHYLNVVFGAIATRITFCVLISSYILLGYTATAELVFYVLSLFGQIYLQISLYLPVYFLRIIELYASSVRLNRMLREQELQQIDEDTAEKPLVIMKNVSLRLRNKVVLDDISVKITEPGLTLVTGPVGSGKSLLLKVILQEYSCQIEGKMKSFSLNILKLNN